MTTVTPHAAKRVAECLVWMNEDTQDYSQHIDGAKQIAQLLADAGTENPAAWFEQHREMLLQTINVELVERGLITPWPGFATETAD